MAAIYEIWDQQTNESYGFVSLEYDDQLKDEVIDAIADYVNDENAYGDVERVRSIAFETISSFGYGDFYINDEPRWTGFDVQDIAL